MSSGSEINLDELMISLKQPLPEISGYLEIIWDVDDPALLDLDKVLGGDLEYAVSRQQLSTEIKDTLIPAIAKKKSIENLNYFDDDMTDINLNKYKRPVKIDNMTVDEVLANLKCKCKAFRDKYAKKASQIIEDQQEFSSFSDYTFGSISSSISDQLDDLRKVQKDLEVPIECPKISIELPKIGAGCKQFLSVKDYAISFIDDLLQEAVSRITPTSFSMNYMGEDDECVQTPSTESTPSVDFASWVSYLLIEDFTQTTGRHLIMEIIKNTWNIKKKWSYCIDFKAEHSDTCADFYMYEVRWSRPTMSYPIPQVTASVYFTIEVSRIKPKDCPVNVSYNFETERFKFTLDDDIQQEVFLENIMKCKMGFFRSIRI